MKSCASLIALLAFFVSTGHFGPLISDQGNAGLTAAEIQNPKTPAFPPPRVEATLRSKADGNLNYHIQFSSFQFRPRLYVVRKTKDAVVMAPLLYGTSVEAKNHDLQSKAGYTIPWYTGFASFKLPEPEDIFILATSSVTNRQGVYSLNVSDSERDGPSEVFSVPLLDLPHY